jgi:hypothetical protein
VAEKSPTAARARRALVNAAIALAAAVLAATVAARVGHPGELAGSLDAPRRYEAVATGGLEQADRAVRTRPLVPLIVHAVSSPRSTLRAPLLGLGRLVDPDGNETRRAFRAMNLVFTVLLAWLISALLDACSASAPVKAIAVFGAFATTAMARAPAFQPVQVDLGALVFLTTALVSIVIGRRWAIVPATMLAVAASEVGVIATVFGATRDWRRGVPRRTLAGTFAPSVVTFLVLQIWARLAGDPASTGALGAPTSGARLLLDPTYLLLAGYGALTVFGGLSLLVVARALAGRVRAADGREWLVYLGSLILVSLVTDQGARAVLVYALPAVAVLFSKAAGRDDWRGLALGVALATLGTQAIGAPMTDLEYLTASAPDLAITNGVFLERHATVIWTVRFGLVAWLISWMGRGGKASLAAYGVGASVLVATLGNLSGLIPVRDGLGWDGLDYVRMMQLGFGEGTPSTRLRPVVLLINGEVDNRVFLDPLAAFRAMNLVYAFVLAVILADLCRRYGASTAATVTLVVNLFLCISVAKMFAFYPVLVDLGAYTFMTACVWAIVTGRRLLVVVTSVLAVLSREFGAVNVLFGIARDLRTGRSLPVVAATYAPAVAAFFWIRRVAAGSSQGAELDERVLSVGALVTTLVSNVRWWSDPAYVALWGYFLATLFGGLSLVALTTPRPWTSWLRSEPEWLAFMAPLVATAALGTLDMWRYSAFLLPALPAFWARYMADVPRGRQAPLLVAVTAATVATERPWQHMDVESYFRDWFPYYIVVNDPAAAGGTLWPAWGYYAAVAIASLGVLVVARHRRRRRPSTSRRP